jgi:hypothetical protein
MHPTGPQPPKVYWVRRALVLGVIVLLLVAVAWLLGGRGGAATGALSGPSASPSPSHPAATSHAPTPTPTTATSRAPSPSASTTRSAAPTAVATPACTTSQLTVTASTDAASYPVGATPHLRMRIENTSGKACTRDLGAAQNELVITSGSAHVWSSDDCNPGGTPQVETLTPGQSYSVAVTWLGKLSQPGCPATQPSATKGTYRLVGRNGTIHSTPATFSLT